VRTCLFLLSVGFVLLWAQQNTTPRHTVSRKVTLPLNLVAEVSSFYGMEQSLPALTLRRKQTLSPKHCFLVWYNSGRYTRSRNPMIVEVQQWTAPTLNLCTTIQENVLWSANKNWQLRVCCLLAMSLACLTSLPVGQVATCQSGLVS
jgi:hypothetical protein